MIKKAAGKFTMMEVKFEHFGFKQSDAFDLCHFQGNLKFRVGLLIQRGDTDAVQDTHKPGIFIGSGSPQPGQTLGTTGGCQIEFPEFHHVQSAGISTGGHHVMHSHAQSHIPHTAQSQANQGRSQIANFHTTTYGSAVG